MPWKALKWLCAGRCGVVLGSRPDSPVKGYAPTLPRLDECRAPVRDDTSEEPSLASTGAPGRRHGLARRVRAVVAHRCTQALGQGHRRLDPRRHAWCDTSARALHQDRTWRARLDHGGQLGWFDDRSGHGAQAAYRPGRPRHRVPLSAWSSSRGAITSGSARSRAPAATIAYKLLCNAWRAPGVTDTGLDLCPVPAAPLVDGTRQR